MAPLVEDHEVRATGLERVKQNLLRLSIATVGHVDVSLRHWIDPLVGVDRG